MSISTLTSQSKPAWQTKTEAYRDQAQAKIPKDWILPEQYTNDINAKSSQNVLGVPAACGILTAREIEITEKYECVDLLAKMASGELSSVEVTTAFCKRAAIAQQLTHCLTETLFDQAIDRAKQLDAYLAEHKKPIGPLHGLPVSVKDSFNIKGISTTIGFVSFLDHSPATDDAALVKILLSLGAVLYAKTNIPQTLMTADSENNIFGRVLNPNKLCLTAGGSSGGEGALVAMKGCPIGVGTDIAGSIRIPAYVNGTFGLRPTARRVPYGGQKGPARAGSFGILPCAGPLGRSIRDIECFMKAVLRFDVWSVDEGVISVPWRDPALRAEAHTKLKLGYIIEDPKIPVHPTILRTLKTAIEKLKKAGHTLIPVSEQLPPSLLEELMESAWMSFAMDPNKTPFQHIAASGEPLIGSIATAASPSLKHFKPELDHVFDFNVSRAKYQNIFKEVYMKNGLDAIMLPTYQGTAVAHDKYGTAMYTVLANLLDYPAMTMPYQKADKSLDAEYVRHVSYTPPYVPEEVEGAPCGIQLMGRPMRDEELVEYSQVVADALGIKAL